MTGDNATFEAAQQARRQEQTFTDLQYEIAGEETGRQKRFRNHAEIAQTVQQQEQRKTQQMMTLLEMMLMNDPEFAKLYNETMDALRQAEIAAQQALEKLYEQLPEQQQALEDTLSDANRLPDGRHIFRDQDGNVYTADGEQITDPVLLETIVWKEDAPTYEEYLEKKQAVEKTQRDIEEVERYQIDVLGGARDRMEDQDKPVTKDEMDGIQRDIREQTPEAVTATLPQPKLAEIEPPSEKPQNMLTPQV